MKTLTLEERIKSIWIYLRGNISCKLGFHKRYRICWCAWSWVFEKCACDKHCEVISE